MLAGRDIRVDSAKNAADPHRQGVTLQLLHVEYLAQHPNGYRYTQSCEHYRRWVRRQRPSMRQVHRAGEKLFVDYSGGKPEVVDPETGEIRSVELFVAVLGASNYTYVEATETQQSSDWIASHVRALRYLGGVPHALVPDQLKSGVTKPSRYEPEIQRTYADLAEHYGTIVLPARPRKPRDKAKVEGAVLIVQRWVLARLRHETFFSLAALNERIAELLEELNDRRMKVYGASRRELYERLDRPALRPPPGPPLRRRGLGRRQGQHRLPRRRRSPLLLGPPSPARRARGRADDLDHGGGVFPGVVGSSRISDPASPGTTRPCPSTCRRRTGLTRNGPPRASSGGARPSVRRPAR